jgi:hypothetical protein
MNQSFNKNMTVLTLRLLDVLPMMALGTILLEGLSMILPGGMAVRTFESISDHMIFMRKFDVVEGDGSFFHPDMAQSGAGHVGSELSGSVILIQGPQSLLRPVVGRIE